MNQFSKKSWKMRAILAFACLTRQLLKLRYKITIRGSECWDQLDRSKAILFLPNHPAQIDPVILLSILFPLFRSRPVVVETFFTMIGLKKIMKATGALEIPLLHYGCDPEVLHRLHETKTTILHGLKKERDNFLIYPAGRLKTAGREQVHGTSLIEEILKAAPDVQIVLVRTVGLWGSRFSKVGGIATPNPLKILLRSALSLAKNFLFFLPKRPVDIFFELAPPDFPRQGSRMEINSYLERWYNQYSSYGSVEPLTKVSYSFWRPTITHAIEEDTQGQLLKNMLFDQANSLFSVESKIVEDLIREVAQLSRRKTEELHPDMHLARDLGLDSLDGMQLQLFCEQTYGVANLPFEIMGTIQEVASFVAYNQHQAKLSQKEPAAPTASQKKRRQEKRLSPSMDHHRDTIADQFLKVCHERSREVAFEDKILGAVRYSDLKKRAIILALYFQKKPERFIGLMLPSTGTIYLLAFALLLAQKVPVLINWTAGFKALNHLRALTQLEMVVSSKRFYQRLEQGALGDLEPMLRCVLGIRKEIGLATKLKGVFLSFLPPKWLEKYFRLNKVFPDDMAALLFTSGTEALPKGVPLSHKNILSNISNTFLAFGELAPQDSLFVTLPPFHSFGFVGNGLLSILSGFKSYYSPDPKASSTIVKEIAEYAPTFLCTVPTFLSSILQAATPMPSALASLRYIVVGAERPTPALISLVEKVSPHACFIQGYGITECSPVVTLGKPNLPILQTAPIPNVELLVFNPATLEPLPLGELGEVAIAGDNVFSGYLGYHHTSPFIEMAGKRWYRSGDLGKIDDAGNLTISGRSKRFAKIGGEMIPLEGIGEEIERIAKARGWVQGDNFQVVVSTQEDPIVQKIDLALLSTHPLPLEELNEALREAGFSSLIKMRQIKTVESIPVTGSGKVNFGIVNALLNNKV